MTKEIGFVKIMKVTGCKKAPGLRMEDWIRMKECLHWGNLALDRGLLYPPDQVSDEWRPRNFLMGGGHGTS